MMSGGSNISKSKLRIIIVDEKRDITHILAGMFGLKGYYKLIRLIVLRNG